MKKKKEEKKALSLKEFRDEFGKDVSLDVVKRAYTYVLNGNQPQTSIGTSAVLYAEPFKQSDFRCLGLMAEKELNAVTIWNLQTETVAAQRTLLQGKWDYHNRAMCIARLGENFICSRRTTLEFPSELIIGVYVHRHRYIAVVSIEADRESAIAVPKLQELADIAAKNALAHYTEYLDRQEKREYYLKHKHVAAAELPEFKEFLLKQPLRFVEGVNPQSILPAKHIVSVEEFIKHRGEHLNLQLNVASVDLFGDFEHI